MISTEDLRFFLLIAKKGSLAATARELNVTPSAVTQRLRQIETRLGVRLIDRTTRVLRLTDDGTLLAEQAHGVVASLDRVVDTLRSRRGVVAGGLSIRAPLGFGRRYIAPIVAQFHTLYPEVRVSLYLTDRPNRAAAERVAHDVIIHIGDLQDSSMVAYPVAANDRLLCASPGYLQEHGEPGRPEDLARHHCLALKENEEDVTLWRLSRGGATQAVKIEAVLDSNDGEVVHQWALADKGVMLRSEWDVAENLRAGRLVRVLSQYRLPAANVVALIPSAHGLSARTKAFIEYCRAQFAPVPPWRQSRAAESPHVRLEGGAGSEVGLVSRRSAGYKKSRTLSRPNR